MELSDVFTEVTWIVAECLRTCAHEFLQLFLWIVVDMRVRIFVDLLCVNTHMRTLLVFMPFFVDGVNNSFGSPAPRGTGVKSRVKSPYI